MHAMNAFWEGFMAMLTVRNLPDEVHRALRVRAALHGRSTEAEVREILAMAVRPDSNVGLGSQLHALFRDIGLTDEEFSILNQAKNRTSAEPIELE
jgi:antitoxin FitA